MIRNGKKEGDIQIGLKKKKKKKNGLEYIVEKKKSKIAKVNMMEDYSKFS